MVYASRHCSEILKRPNARKLMKELGTTARDLYDPGNTEEIIVDGLAADRVLADGDTVSLGKETVAAIETKGHTDCSMSYYLEPYRILFTSESTGLMETSEYVHTPILKSYDDAIVSMKKCRACGAEYLCLPHFGMLPKDFNETYWKMFEEACHEKLAFVRRMENGGLSEDEMVDEYMKKYWNPAKEQEQPIEAYLINARAVVKAIRRAL